MLRFTWHVLIYKANFSSENINAFLENIYQRRDNSGLHFRKLSIDGNSQEMLFTTLIFDAEHDLNNIALQQLAKYMYAQLLVGPQINLPVFARVLQEDFSTLGIDFESYRQGIYDVTMWGVPTTY